MRTVRPWGSGRKAALGGIVVIVVGMVVVVVVVLVVVELVVDVVVLDEVVVVVLEVVDVVEDVVVDEVVELVVGGAGVGVTMQVTFPRVALGSEEFPAEQFTICVFVVSGGRGESVVEVAVEVEDEVEVNVEDEVVVEFVSVVGGPVVVVVVEVVVMGSAFGPIVESSHETNCAVTLPVIICGVRSKFT